MFVTGLSPFAMQHEHMCTAFMTAKMQQQHKPATATPAGKVYDPVKSADAVPLVSSLLPVLARHAWLQNKKHLPVMAHDKQPWKICE